MGFWVIFYKFFKQIQFIGCSASLFGAAYLATLSLIVTGETKDGSYLGAFILLCSFVIGLILIIFFKQTLNR